MLYQSIYMSSPSTKKKMASEDVRVIKSILSFADHSWLVFLPLDHTPAPTRQFLYFGSVSIRRSARTRC